MVTRCNSCIHSKHNNRDGSWCKYSNVGQSPRDGCGCDYVRYESIYTIEPTVVLGSRYYTPQMNDEMKETEPIVFEMEE